MTKHLYNEFVRRQKMLKELVKFCKESGLPILDYNADAIASGSYIEDYNSFYSQI